MKELILGCLVIIGHVAQAGTLLYVQQEVNPSAIYSYMPPMRIPTYLLGGPYLVTRGLGDDIYFPTHDYKADCVGFVAPGRYIHGNDKLVLQSYGMQTGIGLAGPAKTNNANDHYISALYVDYFSPGDDVRPWHDAESFILEAQVSVPVFRLKAGDIGYIQYSVLMEDTSSDQFVWWVWQLYDNRPEKSLEGVGVDITVDGGDYSYVTTTFAPNLLYSTTSPHSTSFQHGAWEELRWFGSAITRQNFERGIDKLIQQFPKNARLSRNPEDYRLRKFYFYGELYLQDSKSSTSKICAQSYRALLKSE